MLQSSILSDVKENLTVDDNRMKTNFSTNKTTNFLNNHFSTPYWAFGGSLESHQATRETFLSDSRNRFLGIGKLIQNLIAQMEVL